MYLITKEEENARQFVISHQEGFKMVFLDELEEQEIDEPDYKPSLYERNRKQLEHFLNWRKKKRERDLLHPGDLPGAN